MENKEAVKLNRGAYEVMGDGEEYTPFVSAQESVLEFSVKSILFGVFFGIVFGALAMVGDLCSSFIKRRSKLEPSARSTGLDQLPESILPSLYACLALDLSWWWAPVLSLAFTAMQALLSKPLYHLHIRKRPY